MVFSSSTVLCWMPLSLLSIDACGGGDAGVVGVFGELKPLTTCSSSGHSLFEKILGLEASRLLVLMGSTCLIKYVVTSCSRR